MPLPIIAAYGLRAGGAMLLKKVIKSKLGKEVKEKLKKAIINKFAKLRQLKDRRKTKAPYKKPQSDKDILLRINRDRLKEEGIVIPKQLKKAASGGGRAKKSKKESRPLKRTTADKVFDTVGSVGLAGFSIDAAVKEHKKPKKDRFTWAKHETSVMKKNKASAKAKAQDGRNPDEKYSY